MQRVVIATCLWDANQHSGRFSQVYDETWVEKLYRGVKRNLTIPFCFVVFTDRPRTFAHEEIEQTSLQSRVIDYRCCTEPFRLNEPMIFMGLDTVVVGGIDHFAAYCTTSDRIAVPRDPIHTETVCNGVVLCPGGMRERMWDRYDGSNDMTWIASNPHTVIDDLWPGQVLSYRIHVKGNPPPADPRIIYFHGRDKPHELEHVDLIRDHWI